MSSGFADASDSLYPKALIPLSSMTLNLLAHDDFEFEKNPKWCKDPNNRLLGPKYHNINCIWVLKPNYLCSWTLRGRLRRLHVEVGFPLPVGLSPYASTVPLGFRVWDLGYTPPTPTHSPSPPLKFLFLVAVEELLLVRGSWGPHSNL